MNRRLSKQKGPLYSQLYARLVEQITSGELKAGDRLPPERELALSMNVSRITARQAIEALAKKGLVYREQGRGTFVAEPKMRGLIGFTSFSEDMRQRGYTPKSQILIQELISVDEEAQKNLKIGKDKLALRLVRVRLADDRPVALQSALIPSHLCPGLENKDLQDLSLYSVLREDYDIHPAWTEAELEALPATAEEARLLQIEKGDPVLIVRGITYSDSFEIIETVRTVYRGIGLALYIGRQQISTLTP